MLYFLRGLVLVVALLSAHGQAQDVTVQLESATAWLLMQQQADGSFQGSALASRWQTSSEAMNAFQAVDQLDRLDQASLLTYFSELHTHETERISRRIRHLKAFGTPVVADRQQLADRQNSNGGFGSEVGFDSSIYDTLFALNAFSDDVITHRDTIAAALAFLQDQQQADGSFLFSDNLPSLPLSSLALLELTPYLFQFDVGTLLSSNQQYVLDQLDDRDVLVALADWQTALALRAVVPVTADTTRYQSVVNRLLAAQQADGSWGQDTYSTALAVQALARIQQAGAVQDPAKAILTGRILVSGQPLANATVTLADQDLTGTTSADGRFTVTDVQPGSFSLQYQAAGYYTSTQSGNVKVGQMLDLGTVQLTPLPNTGVVTGHITAAQDGAPLANVHIHIGGDQNASVHTDQRGFYRVAIAPGDVTVTASLSGYRVVSGAASLQAGREIQFSPSLVIEETSPNTVTLSGSIRDDQTSDLIAVADVAVNGGVPVSVAGGTFERVNVPVGTIQLTVSATGYHAAQIQLNATQGGAVDVGDVRLIPESEPLDYAIVRGQVTSSEDGSPLANALIQVVGDARASGQTDAAGRYRIQAPFGDITLTASLAEYVTSSASVSVPAGAEVVFSPELTPEDPVVQTVTLQGRVIDDQTSALIAGARVSLAGGLMLVEAVDGTFDIPAVEIGSIQLTVNADGYQSVDVEALAAQAGVLNMGDIRLQPSASLETATVFGHVVDADTQVGIPFATVQLTQVPDPDETDSSVLEADPVIVTVQADGDGYFQVTDIRFLFMELFIQSTGYVSHVRDIQLSEFGQQSLTVELAAFSAGGMGIATLTTDATAYPAYSHVEVDAELLNGSDSARRVQASLAVLDASGEQVEQFLIGADVNQAGVPEPVTLLPGVPASVTGDWYTGVHAPGQYRVVLSLFDALDGQVLAQQENHFSIDESRQLQDATLLVSPQISQVTADEQVETSVRVRYFGNVETDYTLHYELVDPDGQALISTSHDVHLQPGDTHTVLPLTSNAVTFELSGQYWAQVEVEDVAIQVVPGWIVVAPSTRIDVRQALTPEGVSPGADKTLNVEILLQGVEQQ